MRLLLVMVCCALLALPAYAEDACADASRAQVSLHLEGEGLDAHAARLVQRHLAASLRARDIALCEPRATGQALAHVTIVVDAAAHVTIRVGDAVTQKRSEREMALAELPADGRPLAIASSADELLRASWAELAMHDVPPRSEPAPPVVLRTVASSVRTPRAPRRDELGAELSGSVLRRRTGFGGKLRYAHYFGAHFGVLGAVGTSTGLRRAARHGSVRADTLDFELGGSYALTPVEARLGASLELSVVTSRVSFEANANRDGEASSFQDWAVSSILRARVWLGAGPVRGALSLGVSYGLRNTHASDEGKPVTSTRGVGGELLLGVCAFL